MAKKKTKRKIENIGRVSADSVFKHTKKDWDQWIPLLDKAGAQGLQRREIVKVLANKYKLTPWWQQIVATGYEQYYGRRVEGVSSKGTYNTTSTKTFHTSQLNLWRWMTSPDGLAVWLNPMSDFEVRKGAFFEIEGGIVGEVRTMLAPDRIRIKWKDEDEAKASYLNIGINGRDSKNKCMWYIVHSDIPNSRAKMQLKERWKSALERSVEALNAAAIIPKSRK